MSMSMPPNHPPSTVDHFVLVVECKLCKERMEFALTPEDIDPMKDKGAFDAKSIENYQKAIYGFVEIHTAKFHPEQARNLKATVERVARKDALKNLKALVEVSYSDPRKPESPEDGQMYFKCVLCGHFLYWNLPDKDMNRFVDLCYTRFARKHTDVKHPHDMRGVEKRIAQASGMAGIRVAKTFLLLKEVRQRENKL